MRIDEFKIKVNPEQSVIVQNVLFNNGYYWISKCQKNVMYTNKKYLCLEDGYDALPREIFFYNNKKSFETDSLEELSFEDFLAKYDIKELRKYKLKRLNKINIKQKLWKKLKNAIQFYKVLLPYDIEKCDYVGIFSEFENDNKLYHTDYWIICNEYTYKDFISLKEYRKLKLKKLSESVRK